MLAIIQGVEKNLSVFPNREFDHVVQLPGNQPDDLLDLSVQVIPEDLFAQHVLYSLDFTSRVRVTSVCRAWRRLSRSAIPVANMPIWIWFAPNEFVISPDGSRRIKAYSLLNLTSATSCQPRQLPLLSGEHFFCCRGGGLNLTMLGTELLSEGVSISEGKKLHAIYNPLSGASFQLPATVLDNEGNRRPMTWFMLTQISAEPPNCLVAAYNGCISLCQIGDSDWIKEDREYSRVYDMIFYQGELYSMEDDRITAYDVKRSYESKNFCSAPRRDIVFQWTDIYEAKWLYQKQHYLVESDGELLLVTQITSNNFYDDGKIEFTVHRIDMEMGRLVPLDDLGGERMLMVGRGCSMSWSIRNKDVVYELPQFFGMNCIFFYHRLARNDDDSKKGMLRLGKYRLNKEKDVTRGKTAFEVHPEYGFPGSKYRPIWFPPIYLN